MPERENSFPFGNKEDPQWIAPSEKDPDQPKEEKKEELSPWETPREDQEDADEFFGLKNDEK